MSDREFQQITVRLDCQLSYDRHCTNQDVDCVEDPYESDVNNRPGVMVWACPACLEQLALDI